MTNKNKFSGCYVINDTFDVVNFNDVAKETYPSLIKGKKCYKCLMDSEAPCDVCPIVNEVKGPKVYFDPIRHIYETVDAINLDEIPVEEFFLKVNNTSGGNLICRKSTFDREAIRPLFSALLKDNFYWHGREYNYKHIKPYILAEQVLKADDDIGLIDYKFLCFSGEPKLLFMDIGVAKTDGTHAEDYYRNIYDMDFNLITDMKETRDNYRVEDIKKPGQWDFMLECCRKLSKPFPHCRVDLYFVGEKVYFGEITFFHGSGYNEFEPYEKDLEVGSWIPLDRSFPKKY